MKVAVSLPDELFARADAAAAMLGVKRSELYARALHEFLEGHGDDPVTARLDALVDELDATGGAAGAAAGRALIDSGGWEW